MYNHLKLTNSAIVRKYHSAQMCCKQVVTLYMACSKGKHADRKCIYIWHGCVGKFLVYSAAHADFKMYPKCNNVTIYIIFFINCIFHVEIFVMSFLIHSLYYYTCNQVYIIYLPFDIHCLFYMECFVHASNCLL